MPERLNICEKKTNVQNIFDDERKTSDLGSISQLRNAGWVVGWSKNSLFCITIVTGWVGGWEKWNFALLFVTQEK